MSPLQSTLVAFRLHGYTPLNLKFLFNLYNFIGIFPVYCDKADNLQVRYGYKFQIISVTSSLLSIVLWYFVHSSPMLDVWKTINPASLLEISLTFLWAFACVNHFYVVARYPSQIVDVFVYLKEVSNLVRPHRTTSRRDCLPQLIVFSLAWTIPVVSIVYQIFHSVFVNASEEINPCIIEFFNNKGFQIVPKVVWVIWIFFMTPLCSFTMYTVQALPLILSYCLWDVSTGFEYFIEKSMEHHDNLEEQEIERVLTVFDKLKLISTRLNKTFGKIVLTNVASSILHLARCISKFSVYDEVLGIFFKFTAADTVLVLLLTVYYLASESVVKVSTLKDWMIQKNVIERISTNRLNVILHDLSNHVICIRGGHIFAITHQFFIRIIGSVVTYFLIMYQFQSNTYNNGV